MSNPNPLQSAQRVFFKSPFLALYPPALVAAWIADMAGKGPESRAKAVKVAQVVKAEARAGNPNAAKAIRTYRHKFGAKVDQAGFDPMNSPSKFAHLKNKPPGFVAHCLYHQARAGDTDARRAMASVMAKAKGGNAKAQAIATELRALVGAAIDAEGPRDAVGFMFYDRTPGADGQDAVGFIAALAPLLPMLMQAVPGIVQGAAEMISKATGGDKNAAAAIKDTVQKAAQGIPQAVQDLATLNKGAEVKRMVEAAKAGAQAQAAGAPAPIVQAPPPAPYTPPAVYAPPPGFALFPVAAFEPGGFLTPAYRRGVDPVPPRPLGDPRAARYAPQAAGAYARGL